MRTKSELTAVALLAGVLALAGCLPLRLSGGEKGPRPLEQRATTNSVPQKVKFHLDIRRNGDLAMIRLLARGTVSETVTATKTYEISEEVKMTFGILPGMASLPPRLVVGGTFFALWYNICFLGTPTLAGLLIEPFNPNPVPMGYSLSDGHAFRRSALLGVHKFELPAKKEEKKDPPTTSIVEKTWVVEGVTMEFDAQPRFWQDSKMYQAGLVLTGVKPGRHKGTLVLKEVPPLHNLKKDLLEWENVEMDVTIPEK